MAPEDAGLSPSLSLRPRDEELAPGREALEATLSAIAGSRPHELAEFASDVLAPTHAHARPAPERDATERDATERDTAETESGAPAPSATHTSAFVWSHSEPSELAAAAAATRPELQHSYLPIEEIGRGGMGVVYRARQTVLHRDIAVKAARFSAREARALKFISEALITASLQHPNIVPVYDLTTTPDARLALAMKLVGGTTWGHLLGPNGSTRRPSTMRESLDLEYHLDVFSAVANALAFAHSRFILHCDLKPANVLIGEFGEVLLVDWGLAFDFHEQPRPELPAPHRSRLRSPCGTPRYMAPELARGDGNALGPWTDVFLLGAVLYEVLTGAPPHPGRTSAEVLWHAAEWRGPDFSRAPAERDIPEALAALCARAMAPEPAQRYQSVAELQDDLRAFREHRQSLAITGRADDNLSACLERGPRVRVGDAHGRSRLYSEFAEAVAGFREAQQLWPDNPQAIAGERRARLAFAKSALEHRDIGLAEAQIALLADGNDDGGAGAAGDAEVVALRGAIREAQAARQRARTHTRRLSRALAAAAVLLIAGLGLGYVLVARERARAVDSRILAERRLADVRRLADAQHVLGLQGEHRALWPALPKNAPRMETWLADAGALTDRLSDHNTYLTQLRARADSAAAPYRFASAEEQWEHDNLSRLVAELHTFERELIPAMEERLAFARTVRARSIDEHRAAWDAARAAIAASPRYGGLRLAPQLGLVPIGADPTTGLWEFAHIQSGAIAARGSGDALARSEEMGIVLVLIPGGSFRMGARPPSEEHPLGSANVDPRARPSEAPVHEVSLAPFFLSKYEMTQAQWQRFTGDNPSSHTPGMRTGGRLLSALHPVEMIRWHEAAEVAAHLDLTLPTEAQWEYAMRAGTSSVYPSGDEESSLRGTLNIADAYCSEHGGPGSWQYELWLDDGHVVHAPVGSYRGNGFGLHDMAGNVWEWCLDRYGSYELPVAEHSGERQAPADAPHVFRGGGFRANGVHARSADRYSLYTHGYRGYDVGMRPARRIDPAGDTAADTDDDTAGAPAAGDPLRTPG